MTTTYGLILIALGCWATFTTARTVALPRGLRTHKTLVLAGAAFVASCFLPGLAMLRGRFSAWMLVPLGACYFLLLPMPCYFGRVNHGWMRRGRNALFLAVGAGLVAAGLGLLPLRWLGL